MRENRKAENTIPDYVESYLRQMRADARDDFLEEVDLDAFAHMNAELEREKSPVLKEFMRDAIKHVCAEGAMLLSFVHANLWREWLKEQRRLQKTIRPIELYIALESLCSRHTDSSEYTKGHSNKRYLLNIPGNFVGCDRVANIERDMSPSRFLKSYYKFGSHRFEVGHALRDILLHLESRYGLDFAELERKRKS